MKTPKEIYIQTGPYRDLHQRQWRLNKIHDSDIKYIRADLVLSKKGDYKECEADQ